MRDGGDAAAGADGGAVEGGGGAGEIKLVGEWPAADEAEDEAGAEHVASTGGVSDGHAVGLGDVEAGAIEDDGAFFTEGGAAEAAAVAGMHGPERGAEVVDAGEALGEVVVDDEEIDEREELLDARVEVVEIGGDEDAGLAGPAGGECGGGGVMAIKVEDVAALAPGTLEVLGLKVHALIFAAEDGALAGGVNDDETLGADAVRDGDDFSMDAGAGEGVAVEAGGVIFTELTDVAGAQAPVGAGDDGGGDLAAGESAGAGELDFGAAGGVLGDGDDGVGSVETDADDINFMHAFNLTERN